MLQRYSKLLFIFLAFSIFISCHQNRYKVNVKNIEVDIPIYRIDLDMCEFDSVNYFSKFNEISSKYPIPFKNIYELLTERRFKMDSAHAQVLRELYTDQIAQEIYSEVKNKFSNIDDLQSKFNDAFKHYKFYFPSDTLYEVYALVSNFSFGAGALENKLYLSTDFYLGKDNPVYEYSQLPKYILNFCREEYILSESMKAIFTDKFYFDDYCGENLLSQMIYHGKQLFFTDLMLPNVHDTIKMRYSKKELAWCKKYEGELWAALVKNGDLYTNKSLTIDKYLQDAPFTNANGFPQDSPPRLGAWVGWQIIRQYASQFEIENITQVFENKDAQEILIKSKYKPKI